jgi:cytochrome oxidase Cu insertion factor (SCO1/SenC/PrrC family)
MRLKIGGALAILVIGLACGPIQESPPDELAPRTTPVQVGETAPVFTLEDQNQQKVSLASARGHTPVVLVFYRGHW